MKKIFSFLLLLLMSVMLFSVGVLADEEPSAMDVFVSISDENGNLVLAKESVHVTDGDGDGALTVNDALIAANARCRDDAYATEAPYGDLIITKLWGISDRAYGCFNNDALVWRLTEYIAPEDHIRAFIYTDTETKSDLFTYFSKNTLTFENGKAEATLYAYTITKDNNLLSKPVAGAMITVNGKETGIKTDKDGKFTISADKFSTDEKNVISARSDRERLVPPVLIVTPDAADGEKTLSPATLSLCLSISVILVTAAVFGIRVVFRKRTDKAKKS